MAVAEVLVVQVGGAVAKALFKLWFKDSALATDVSADVSGILLEKFPNYLERRRASRQIDRISEEVAAKLSHYFDTEFGGLPDNEKEAAAITVAETIESSPITDNLLLGHDLDPSRLESHFRSCKPRAAETAQLSEAASHLYDFTLREACNYIVEISMNLPAFGPKAVRELLQRETELIRLVNQALENLIPAVSATTEGDSEAAEFETEYRRAVVRKLDYLELFGINVSEASRRYALSIAYITLSTTNPSMAHGVKNRNADRIERYDDSLTAPTYLGNRVNADDEDAHLYLRVSEALAGHDRILVRGEAGSGKTTLLQWLAVQCARGGFDGPLTDWNGSVPFLIELRRYAKAELPAPGAFLDHVAKNLAELMPKGWVHQQLEKGRALILIDGVDELPEADRKNVRQWVRDLTADFPDSKYVVTSRPPAISQRWLDGSQFTDTELQPMALEDIDAFIDHWHEAASQEITDNEQLEEIGILGEKLRLIIRDNRPIRGLATSPLLCAMLCALNRERRTHLPKDRMELYRIALEMLLDRRDIERDIQTDSTVTLSLREKELLLQDFAYWLILNNRTDAEIDSAVDRFGRKLNSMPNVEEQVEPVFQYLLIRSGLLRRPVEGRVDFIHRTFQEYLAGKEAVEEDHIGLLVENAHKDEWREVIVLAAGHARRGQREELIRELLDRGDRESRNRHRLHLLAAACLETSLQLPPELASELKQRLEDMSPPKNMTEARALASAGELAIPLLVKHKKKPVPVATACIRALTLIGTDEALRALQEFSQDWRLTVLKELVRAWGSFDVKDFAETILRTSKLDRGTLTISDVNVIPGVRYLENLVELRCDMRGKLRTLEKFSSLEGVEARIVIDAGWPRSLRDLSPLASVESLAWLSLNSSDVVDLAPLRELKSLEYLDLSNCDGVTDLDALGGLSELRTLYLNNCINIEDIGPLQRLQACQDLSLSRCRSVSSIEPIRGMRNLRKLSIDRCGGVKDLFVVDGMENLEHIDTSFNPEISSLTPLARSTRLRSLTATDLPKLRSLEDLKELHQLISLNISRCPALLDLSPIAGLERLQTLTVAQCKGISNLSPLEWCVELRTLNVDRCDQLTSLGPLSRLVHLRELDIGRCPKIQDLSPLSELTLLRRLDMRAVVGVTDLSPLRYCRRLRYLNLTECREDLDLAPLVGMNDLWVAPPQRLQQDDPYRGERYTYYTKLSDLLS